MTLVKDINKPKTARQEVKAERRAFIEKHDTSTIIADLMWKHRVGLLVSGYPTLALGVLAWFIAVH